MSQQEDQLAALLLENVDGHFKQFVESYQHQLFRLIYRRSGSTQDAEDIVQETFLRAYYALRDYAAQGVRLQRVRPWLYKIALNLLYNKRRATHLQLLSLDISGTEEVLALESPGPTPEELAGQQESLSELAQVIASLPEHYRVVMNLYYFQQLNYQEIAQRLHQPLGTVKSKVSRGLTLVRAALNDDDARRSM